jgi:hypothetical protein
MGRVETHRKVLLAIRLQLSIAHEFHALEQTHLASTGYVECCEAAFVDTLDASSYALLAQRTNLDRGEYSHTDDPTHKLPTVLWHQLDTLDGLHVNGIADAQFGNPDGAQQVRPVARCRLFEGASFVGTEEARDGILWRHCALAAEPLALGDVGNAVTVLVDCKVTSIAEDNCVRVLPLAVVADGAL